MLGKIEGKRRRAHLDQYIEFVKLLHQIMSRRGELLTTSSIVEALGEMGFMLLAVGEEESC